MSTLKTAQNILSNISQDGTKLGDLRSIAKEIKKDHQLAIELWRSNGFMARQLAILIMDKKELNKETIDQLFNDIEKHNLDERNQLADWLMANQLSKDKNTTSLMLSWQQSPLKMQRRLFWYHQARLRWMGQTPPGNTQELLNSIESDILKEEPEVQWAMNFVACQVGLHDSQYRDRCIAIGESTELYKNDFVHKGCTPSYIPEFIRIEAEKKGL